MNTSNVPLSTLYYGKVIDCPTISIDIICLSWILASPVRCQFTDEEWKYLNDIYKETDAVDGDFLYNDSEIVPSPKSVQDFYCPTNQTFFFYI